MTILQSSAVFVMRELVKGALQTLVTLQPRCPMKRLLCCALLLLAVSPSQAGFIVGAGNLNQPGYTLDGAFDVIAVDLTNPATLGPGTYTASLFNYQFSSSADVGVVVTGSITPILLTGGGSTFTPLAVGDTITHGGPTSFQSSPFAGSNTFTLAADATVYAGIYWHATQLGPDPSLIDERNPVGFMNDVGSAFVIFGGGTGSGANAPVVGTAISGTGQGFFARTYNFSVEVNSVVVPAPSTFAMVLSGAGLLGCYWLRIRFLRRFPS